MIKKTFLVVLLLACSVSVSKKVTDASYEYKPVPTVRVIKVEIECRRILKQIEMTTVAYYRPLPEQKKYVRGSYKKEIRLNGKGVETRSGTRPRIGTVAADPRVIPLGTILWIPGYGKARVEDTGGAIKGRKLDLFMGEGDEGREKAMRWGKKRVIAEILAE